jgi:hypothetical protein
MVWLVVGVRVSYRRHGGGGYGLDQAIAGPLGRLAHGSEAAGQRLATSDADSLTGRLPRLDEASDGARATIA